MLKNFSLNRQARWTIFGVAVLLVAGLGYAPFYTPTPAKQRIAESDCALESMLGGLDGYGDTTVFRSRPYRYGDNQDQRWSVSLRTDASSGIKAEFNEQGRTVCEAVTKLYDKVAEWPLTTQRK